MFRLDRDVVLSVDENTIKKTLDDMREAGLMGHPFPSYVIESDATILDILSKEFDRERMKDTSFRFDEFKKSIKFSEVTPLVFVYATNLGKYKATPFFKSRDGLFEIKPNSKEILIGLAEKVTFYLVDMLTVLLATKNTERKTVVNDPLSRTKRVRDDAKHYPTTTTIKIGKITETERGGSGRGGPVRPHLRRGHLRNQRVGSGRSEVKRIFIQPCFVNADREWIEMAKNYKVKM